MMACLTIQDLLQDGLIETNASLLGPDAKLELYNRDDALGATLAHTLTVSQGWAVVGEAFGDGHQWDIDIWALTWAQMGELATAKLYAWGQVLTFRIDLNSRRLLGGHVCRLGMHVVGDGR